MKCRLDIGIAGHSDYRRTRNCEEDQIKQRENRRLGDDLTVQIVVSYRIVCTIHIQVSGLGDGGDLWNAGVGPQAEGVLALVDGLRVVTVDHVRDVPVPVRLREAANGRRVVSGAEVIGPRLVVKVLAAVAEGVDARRVVVQLVPEGVVAVGHRQRARAAGELSHVAVSVVEEVADGIRPVGADQIRAPEVIGMERVALRLRRHAVAVQQEGRDLVPDPLARADAAGIVAVGRQRGKCGGK